MYTLTPLPYITLYWRGFQLESVADNAIIDNIGKSIVMMTAEHGKGTELEKDTLHFALTGEL